MKVYQHNEKAVARVRLDELEDFVNWTLTIKQEKLKQTGGEEMKAKYDKFDLGTVSYLDIEKGDGETKIEMYSHVLYQDLPQEGNLTVTKNNTPIFQERVRLIRARFIASKDTERLELNMSKCA